MKTEGRKRRKNEARRNARGRRKMTITIEVRFASRWRTMVVVMVVVWTVSWPRRERCPGTLRVTIPRLHSSSPFSPPSSPPPYISSLYTTCSPFPRLFSLSLFLPYLSVNLSSAFPRSFYCGLPRAGRPFRAARLTNMAVGRSLP